MNLDELRSVQDRERQKDSLQHLRDSFYEEVGRYVADLKAERDRQAEQADDPFGSEEVRRLTDEIETAEEVAESIYERRMGKVVKNASLAAAGYATDTEGLTAEEEALFENLVERIQENKETVLDVLAGTPTAEATGGDATTTEPAGGGTTASDPSPEPSSIDAPSTAEASDAERESTPSPEDDPTTDGTPASADDDRPPTEATAVADPAADGSDDAVSAAAAMGGESSDGTDAIGDSSDGTAGESSSATGGQSVDPGNVSEDDERATLRITDDVGEIFGVDGTAYDLSTDDVVALPEENAEPLVEKDAATRID